MLVVETVVRIRREHANGKPIKAIARDLKLSRKSVRKAIRAPEGAFDYSRTVQPFPRMGPFQERLQTLLIQNEDLPRRDRLRMTRIDRIFDIERGINGKTADERLAVRQELTTPLVNDLEHWLREKRAMLARHTPVAVAIGYMLKDWTAFTRFLADGRICLTNNAAERALRGIALGRKSWLFAGSDRGGQRAAFVDSLIVTAKLNDIDPQAWLADVLARIADLPQNRLAELLPWNWQPDTSNVPLAQAA